MANDRWCLDVLALNVISEGINCRSDDFSLWTGYGRRTCKARKFYKMNTVVLT